MARLFHPNPPDRRSKYPAFVLALSYFAGLLFGVFVFRFAGDRLDSLMRGAPTGAVSIVGLLGVTVVPFLFSAFAVSLSKPALLFPVSFINAFLFCFVSLGMMRCAGSAGWLIRWLLCFSGSVFAPVLGSDASKLSAGTPYTFTYRVISRAADWYDNYTFTGFSGTNLGTYATYSVYGGEQTAFACEKLQTGHKPKKNSSLYVSVTCTKGNWEVDGVNYTARIESYVDDIHIATFPVV